MNDSSKSKRQHRRLKKIITDNIEATISYLLYEKRSDIFKSTNKISISVPLSSLNVWKTHIFPCFLFIAMDSKYLFNTFFEEHSSVDKNYRFTAKGLQLAMQVFWIIEDQLFNEASSHDSQDAVKSVKSDFKRIVCLLEKAHKARKAIVVAFRARNHGIGESRSPDEMDSESLIMIRNAVTVVLKVVICK